MGGPASMRVDAPSGRIPRTIACQKMPIFAGTAREKSYSTPGRVGRAMSFYGLTLPRRRRMSTFPPAVCPPGLIGPPLGMDPEWRRGNHLSALSHTNPAEGAGDGHKKHKGTQKRRAGGSSLSRRHRGTEEGMVNRRARRPRRENGRRCRRLRLRTGEVFYTGSPVQCRLGPRGRGCPQRPIQLSH